MGSITKARSLDSHWQLDTPTRLDEGADVLDPRAEEFRACCEYPEQAQAKAGLSTRSTTLGFSPQIKTRSRWGACTGRPSSRAARCPE
jgi:hypothetical protein